MDVADIAQVESRVKIAFKNQYPIETSRRRLFTIEEYDLLIKIGFLGEDDNIELLDGDIVCMSPIGPNHIDAVNRLNRRLNRIVDDSVIVSIQNSIALPPNSEPEPDVALIREFDRNTGPRLAGPADILLLIEVADSSLEYDRETKIPRYSASGIPEVWLVNLAERCVEVYSNPQIQGYRDHQSYWEDETVQSVTMPNIAISVDHIIGTD